MTYTPSVVLGEVIIAQLIEQGVTDAVISPGSRNAPLTMALWRAATAGKIRLHTRIDERSAAFLALGIAKASGRITPVVSTSGSAVANFHPAMLEAHHSSIPLVAITADRPARLWQTGTNQSTNQVGIFRPTISRSINISAAQAQIGLIDRWRNDIFTTVVESAPSHINVEFDEPLIGSLDWPEPLLGRKLSAKTLPTIAVRKLARFHPHGVILVGHDAAGISVKKIEALSLMTGWPILSENPIIFTEAIAHTSLILSSERRRILLQPEIALVIGRLTLSRSVNTYLATAKYRVIVDARMKEIDIKREGDELHFALPEVTEAVIDLEWSERFRKFSQEIGVKLSKSLPEWSEPNILRSLVSALAANSTLFISSSRPIRDIETFANIRGDIETFSNRGLAGIDGNCSTALGIALSRSASYAVLGDLAFLHDINGFLLGPEELRPNLTMVLISNDGGGIFSTLPQADFEGFEKIFGTPHGRDLEAVASSYGIKAVTIRSIGELLPLIRAKPNGIQIIICAGLDRKKNSELLGEITESLATL